MKILTIVGARPQFVKAAVVSRALLNTPGVNEMIVHTGQHFDGNMSDIFFDELNIPRPRHNLGIGGGSHGANTGRMLEGLETLILAEKPDWVLVYGDTDSTLAGALAAAKLCVRVAHIEAGLRSFNREMPEEINRIMTDHLSSLLFAPTKVAVSHLASEGIGGGKVQRVGDVMYDAIRLFNPIAVEKSTILRDMGLQEGAYALCTLHRKENTDAVSRLQAILSGLGDSHIPIILPLHPRTRKMIAQRNLDIPKNITVVDPVGYLDMISLQRHAMVIGTDSGGVQKEAYFQGVPCVTFRDETEWTELIEMGVNRLVGADRDQIRQAMLDAQPIARMSDVYGNGDAADLIAGHLKGSLGNG